MYLNLNLKNLCLQSLTFFFLLIIIKLMNYKTLYPYNDIRIINCKT